MKAKDLVPGKVYTITFPSGVEQKRYDSVTRKIESRPFVKSSEDVVYYNYFKDSEMDDFETPRCDICGGTKGAFHYFLIGDKGDRYIGYQIGSECIKKVIIEEKIGAEPDSDYTQCKNDCLQQAVIWGIHEIL